MKISKRFKQVAVVTFGIVLLAVCYYMGIRYIIRSLMPVDAASEESSSHYVVLVAKSTEPNYWKTVFAGANVAATEYNLTLSCEGPMSEEDYQAQNEIIARAVEDGAEALIFSSIDYNANAEAVDAAAAAGVKVVVIDSDVNSGAVSCRISTDNYEAGKMMTSAILENEADELNVGVINFDENTANGQQREEGLRDGLAEDARAQVAGMVTVISTEEAAKEATIGLLEENPEINVVVAFNEITSLGVCYAMEELDAGDEVMAVVFDSNVTSVGMLESGAVDALIVQSPYAMGYLSVECAYELINGIALESDAVDTKTTVVTRENMYDEECQKVLFTFD